MSIEQFWAELRRHGFTKHKELHAGGKTRIILQTRDKDYTSITCPFCLSYEERVEEIARFLRYRC